MAFDEDRHINLERLAQLSIAVEGAVLSKGEQMDVREVQQVDRRDDRNGIRQRFGGAAVIRCGSCSWLVA